MGTSGTLARAMAGAMADCHDVPRVFDPVTPAAIRRPEGVCPSGLFRTAVQRRASVRFDQVNPWQRALNSSGQPSISGPELGPEPLRQREVVGVVCGGQPQSFG